jgi:hypothetical protein
MSDYQLPVRAGGPGSPSRPIGNEVTSRAYNRYLSNGNISRDIRPSRVESPSEPVLRATNRSPSFMGYLRAMQSGVLLWWPAPDGDDFIDK